MPANERLSAGRILSHLAVMIAVAAVMGVVVAGLAIPFAGALGIGARGVANSIEELPADLETQDLAQKTQIVDAEGNTIATLYDENRINVPLSQISRTMVKAIVAIEDYRFYEHGALDLKGTLRALVTNQASAGVVQGGSSITQQMVKLTLVDQAETNKERRAATDDTYARKLQELRYAIAFEQNYSKDWILERYLNIAYFGDGAFGIQAAARHYFDKNAKDLDLRESAMLAGLVKNPTGYDPTNAPDRSLARRNVVLDRMAQLSVIGDKKAEKTKELGLGLHLEQTRNGCVFSDRAVLLRLRRQLPDEGPAARQDARGAQEVPLLRRADDPDHHRPRHAGRRRRVGAQRTSSPATPRSAGWPGWSPAPATSSSSPSRARWVGTRQAGQTYLNYVVPEKYGDSQGFQAGSTFKVFVLAAAIEKGIPLSDDDQLPGAPHPREERLQGLQRPPVQLRPLGGLQLDHLGHQGHVHRHPRVGEHLLRPARDEDRPVQAVPPGQGDGHRAHRRPAVTPRATAPSASPPSCSASPSASPLEMAEAYATFAGRGLHCPSRPVTAVEDSDGNQIREYTPNCRQVMAGPRRTRSTTSCAASRSPAASATARASTSPRSRPARPARSTRTARCGSSATPPTWRPRR